MRMDRTIQRLTSLAAATILITACASRLPPPPQATPPAVAKAPPPSETTPSPVSASQPKIELQASAPETYVVKKGDTLWDIAKKFLQKPWYWPEIWQVNPAIKNPHLIYPGDVISLYYVNGQPRLGINRSQNGSTYKLSPSIRTEKLDERDIGIPISAVRPFLIRPEVVSEEELKQAAHILDSREARLIYGNHDQVYVHGLQHPRVGERYSVFRPGKALLDPTTGEPLGFEAMHVSDAQVVRTGRLDTVELQGTVKEVLRGDRLLPLASEMDGLYFVPHAPKQGTQGTVISIVDALSQVAQYQIAVINVGRRNGVHPGHVFEVYEAGRVVSDPYDSKQPGTELQLPEEQVGLLMVFRSFEKLSYGLIMESSFPIRKGYKVAAP